MLNRLKFNSQGALAIEFYRKKYGECFGERPFTPTPLSFPQNKKLILKFKKSRFREKNN